MTAAGWRPDIIWYSVCRGSFIFIETFANLRNKQFKIGFLLTLSHTSVWILIKSSNSYNSSYNTKQYKKASADETVDSIKRLPCHDVRVRFCVHLRSKKQGVPPKIPLHRPLKSILKAQQMTKTRCRICSKYNHINFKKHKLYSTTKHNDLKWVFVLLMIHFPPSEAIRVCLPTI